MQLRPIYIYEIKVSTMQRIAAIFRVPYAIDWPGSIDGYAGDPSIFHRTRSTISVAIRADQQVSSCAFGARLAIPSHTQAATRGKSQ